jgi:hypothetical protein
LVYDLILISEYKVPDLLLHLYLSLQVEEIKFATIELNNLTKFTILTIFTILSKQDFIFLIQLIVLLRLSAILFTYWALALDIAPFFTYIDLALNNLLNNLLDHLSDFFVLIEIQGHCKITVL